MTRREDKKQAKRGSGKNSTTDITHIAEMKKHTSKGTIKKTD